MKTVILFFLWSISLISQTNVKQDKLAHFGAGALVSSLSYAVIYKHTKNAPKSLLYSTACAFLVGTAKEVYDIKYGSEGFGAEDLFVTTFGGFVTSSFITIAVKDKKKQKQLDKIEQLKKEEPLPVEIPLAVQTSKAVELVGK
jgi:uncharacterized protein YfiM (DUF2279 family)